MASPQTRNLKTANGGKVAPQHYNDAMGDFEYSKGSDGALHTKVINQPSVTLVDKNGNPIDSENKLPVDVAFPTEQAVKDADVLAKLADIETKIQATNDRLNQTLNTQLTGSSLTQDSGLFTRRGGHQEIPINAVSIAAGSSKFASFVDVTGYDSVTVFVGSDAAHNFSLRLDWSPDAANLNGHYNANIVLNNQSLSANSAAVSRQQGLAKYMRVVLINNDTTAAHTMTAWVFCI